MKGSNHLLLTGITVISLYLTLTYLIGDSDILSILKINMFEFSIYQTLGFVMIMVGAILPDADVDDRNSKIFYSVFAPIAWFYRLFETFASFVPNVPRKHRGILHNPFGILLTTMCFLGLISLSLYAIGFQIGNYIVIAYIALVAGQLLHVFQDHLSDRIPLISGLVYLFLLLVLNIALVIAFPLIFAGLR